MINYLLTDVPKYGWLCRINKDGAEIYRGEYQMTYFEAMEKALEWQEENG